MYFNVANLRQQRHVVSYNRWCTVPVSLRLYFYSYWVILCVLGTTFAGVLWPAGDGSSS